ncbi:dynein associated protein-domain-containing protein [Massariosphaeria phaeospora]|uniref:Dynein associated protein-domain-containing protein n=1 Tax=Massariosphaeria phaeospora TaxID=100035 RepID=A0A7C8MBJ0_9PLEO|nr:dynein associated protein-domain-containing protein [Massariosphaeria phaeospora]
MAQYKVGQTVEMTDGRKGQVKYVGEIEVAPGQFIGIELSTPTGKNDGSVSTGQRYWQCKPLHGLFVRSTSIVRVVAQAPASRVSIIHPAPASRTSTIQPTIKSQATSARRATLRPQTQRKPSPPSSQTTTTSSRRLASSSTSASTEALSTKIQILEKQYATAQDQLKGLENVRSERDRFESLIQKLQSKCQAFHTDVSELRLKVKQLEAENTSLSKAGQDSDSYLERVALNQQMAEERAERAEEELEDARSSLEEITLQLEIFKKETDLFQDSMSDEDRQATGYYRLQVDNDSLREALRDLRDLSNETERELKDHIKDLEGDQAELENVKKEKAILEERIHASDAIIDDLRQQIDAISTQEELIEDLATENNILRTEVSQKESSIKQLVHLKEISDELEAQHTEAAEDLQLELDAKDVEIAEQATKLAHQEATIAEQESLIEKFRDLVFDLRSKQLEVESSKLMSDEQTKDVTGRFNEVMELNRRLRTTNLTSTIKTITSDLRKLEADQATEELAIIKCYLPDSGEAHQSDPLRSYLQTKAIDSKAHLILSLVKGPDIDQFSALTVEQNKDGLVRADVCHQLKSLGISATQLWSSMAAATPSEFNNFGAPPTRHDLQSVESTLDQAIESLKRDDFDLAELSKSAQKARRTLRMVTSSFSSTLLGRPEREILYRAASIHCKYEWIYAAIQSFEWGFSALFSISSRAEPELLPMYERLSNLSADYSRTMTAAKAFVSTLQTLTDDGLYPRFAINGPTLAEVDTDLDRLTTTLQGFAESFLTCLIIYQQIEHPARSQTDDTGLAELLAQLLREEDLEAFKEPQQIYTWTSNASNLMNNLEIERIPAPWVSRALEMESTRKETVNVKERLREITAKHHATILKLREQEETIDTKDLEIEHLRAKHGEASAKLEEQDRLSSLLKDAESDRERLHQDIIEGQQELKRLRDQISAERLDTLAQVSMPIKEDSERRPESIAYPMQPSKAVKTLLTALSNENHWLRKREHADMSGCNLQASLSGIRDARDSEHVTDLFKKTDDLYVTSPLKDSPASAPRTPQRPVTWDITELNDWAPDAESTPIKTPNKTPINLLTLSVTPVEASSDPCDSQFTDLSPIAEEFSMAMTEDWEEFSEVVLGEEYDEEALEGFSAINP